MIFPHIVNLHQSFNESQLHLVIGLFEIVCMNKSRFLFLQILEFFSWSEVHCHLFAYMYCWFLICCEWLMDVRKMLCILLMRYAALIIDCWFGQFSLTWWWFSVVAIGFALSCIQDASCAFKHNTIMFGISQFDDLIQEAFKTMNLFYRAQVSILKLEVMTFYVHQHDLWLST